MRSPLSQRTIRPKISNMPRQKSEATAYLNIYQLVVEKKRLQQELESIENRRSQIQQRLGVLKNQIAHLENSVHQERENPPAREQLPAPTQTRHSGNFETPTELRHSGNLDMLLLEY